ncbi:hypothetical protein KR038_009329 [Drosophila bunnanda]|nr:hypothetical protein KR038_009329 [Drosophila bunnanda]
MEFDGDNTNFNGKRMGTCTLDYDKERVWEPSYLRARCKELHLEEEYKWYQVRLMTNYLGVFFLLHIAVSATSTAMLLLLTEYTYRVYPDVAVVVINAFLVPFVLSINFFEDIVRQHRWVLVLSSVLATMFLVGADLGLVTYHYIAHGWSLNSSMDIYALCMIYMFLPIPSVQVAAILGFIVSVLYVGYYMKVLSFLAGYAGHNFQSYNTITVDILHFFGFTMMGIFFRIMNDTVVRASFLDRHQFIMEENWLRHALAQESMLLDNTLPPQVAKPYQENIRNKILQLDGGPKYKSTGKYASSMAVQMHSDVSILYADVVNYTHLTTTLSVESLVKVLHDLYGRFDMAAAIYKVQRIKFLGDCYYCVAGLEDPDPDHAQNTVALGLAMIFNIQEVRAERKLDIDMRIGVHSGSLFAGIIGQVKLQFDIWGRLWELLEVIRVTSDHLTGADVDIANQLEATGEPGSVHISGRTLSMLNASNYTILPGTKKAQEDPILQKNPMSTYLIAGSVYSPQLPGLVTRTPSAIDIRSRPVQGAVETSDSMSEELREEFRKMPVGGFDIRLLFWCKRRPGDTTRKPRREIGCLCTEFKDPTLERNYLHQPDFTFKGSILLAWVTGVCLIYVEIMTNVCWDCIAINVVTFGVLTFLLFIAWYKKICWWKNSQKTLQYGRFSCCVFRLYEKIQCSTFLRIFCYLVTIACYNSVILLIVSNCDRSKFELEYIESKLFHYEVNLDTCFHTWPFTNMIALIIGLSYTFARIPFSVKTCVSCLEAIIYLLVLFFEYQFVFQHSNTTAPFLPPEVAHCARILLMLITLYVKERQVEFNTKTNYRLNVNLKKKQKMANATNQSILVLLNNILPSHVVTHYLDALSKHELYYENYKMVSVMFAKLMNFKMDLPCLRVLNCIISEFDTLLTHYKQYYLVEKIKVVGCTYMAACGLDFNLAAVVKKGSTVRISRLMERDRSSRFFTEETEEVENQEAVVFLMTTFALDLMRTLAACNKAYSDAPFDRYLSSTQISIGISSGEVMAGVVGASQPHYDIWGNPVNMASRMQSTGLPGHIQVTEESAMTLINFGIECYSRGLTFVKGRGQIPTYFVALDKKLHFISNERMLATSKRFSVLGSFSEEVESSS